MNVLLTGATGYIGNELMHVLLRDDSVHLRILVRNKKKLPDMILDKCEVIEGSTFDLETLSVATINIDAAYYLIHSMSGKGDYEIKDRTSAQNFLNACIKSKVKRLIYLGGLGDKEDTSKHLKSRIETGEILSSRPKEIQTYWFRAGIIIGSGSASFEIIRNLIGKLPVMITPKWVRSKTEPIGIRDVLSYLTSSLFSSSLESQVIDIGSGEKTFQDMLLVAAEKMGLKRYIIPVPLFTPKLSSYWLVLFTPVPYGIASSLVEGLKYESIKINNNAEKLFPDIIPESYEVSVDYALKKTKDYAL